VKGSAALELRHRHETDPVGFGGLRGIGIKHFPFELFSIA
jgi:hypothetical protein